MSENRDFRADFVDNLTGVGDILSQNGYEIQAYTGNLNIGGVVKAAGHGDTPEQALDQTLNEIDEKEMYEVFIPGDMIKKVYQGEYPGLDELMYGNLTGMVGVEEPTVRYSQEEGDYVEAEPSADPVNDDSVHSAFGLLVEYHPEQSGDGHWEIGSLDTMHPFTKDDAREEVDQIAEVLEENDVNYEIGLVQ